MNFKEFQNQSRLYVIGALEAEELEDFEKARKKFGKKAEDYIGECYGLHEAFALSLRPLSTAQVAQDEFLQKTVEVYLEQTQVPARPNGRAKVIAQFAFGEVIFCRDDQTRLI